MPAKQGDLRGKEKDGERGAPARKKENEKKCVCGVCECEGRASVRDMRSIYFYSIDIICPCPRSKKTTENAMSASDRGLMGQNKTKTKHQTKGPPPPQKTKERKSPSALRD